MESGLLSALSPRTREEHIERQKEVLLEEHDLRGCWKAGKPLRDGLVLEEYLKPFHPKFSINSIYHGVDGFEGGEWRQVNGERVFFASITNVELVGVPRLLMYASIGGWTLVLPESFIQQHEEIRLTTDPDDAGLGILH